MAVDAGKIARAALEALAAGSDSREGSESREESGTRKSRTLSGAKGMVAGAALGAVVPIAGKGALALVKHKLKGSLPGPKDLASKATEKVRDGVGETLGNGGPADAVRDIGSGLFSNTDDGGGRESGESGESGDSREGGGDGGGARGTGTGRRMPVQQAVDVAVPVETAFNQWTQFTDWPTFMHRLEQVEQRDDCTVAFSTKIWGVSRRFEADIIEQRPDERIKWEVGQGITHTGVVTFHPLGDRLTRIELTVDIEPEGMIEKAARGMRFVKRAMRADMHRFKAFIEMNEEETGAWRGVIQDGELVEAHPEDYDYEDDEPRDDRADEEAPEAAEDEGPDRDEEEDPDYEEPEAEADEEPEDEADEELEAEGDDEEELEAEGDDEEELEAEGDEEELEAEAEDAGEDEPQEERRPKKQVTGRGGSGRRRTRRAESRADQQKSHRELTERFQKQVERPRSPKRPKTPAGAQ